jgi:hypothetical protein
MRVVLAQTFQNQTETLSSLNILLTLIFTGMFLIWYLLSRRRINKNKQKELVETLIKKRVRDYKELSMDELLEIEENLLAIKELFRSNLISADVYIQESLKYARKFKG